MSNEPDNFVLHVLREIRAKVDKLDQHDGRFDNLDKKLEMMQSRTTQALSIAGMAHMMGHQIGDRMDGFEERQKRFEDGMSELKRRMAEVEAKLDP